MNQYVQILFNEIKVELIVYFQNRVAVISDFLIYSVLYAFFLIFKTGYSLAGIYGVDDSYATILMFVGYFIWMTSTSSLTSISSEIMYEVNNGFLFSKLTSVFPLQYLYAGKTITSFIMNLAYITPLFLFTMFSYSLLPISAGQVLKVILAGLINIIGMYGLGLILASLTMANKRLSSVSLLLSSVLLFTTNALTFNEAMGTAFRYFPANYCIDYTRSVIADPSYTSGDYMVFLLICIALLAAGSFIFNLSIRKAKKAGNILWY